MLDPDYDAYMDVQQSINLGLVRAFAREDVGFAYPTRTVHVAGPIAIAAAQAG